MSEVENSDFRMKLRQFWHKVCKSAQKARNASLTRLARWIDPKLQPYRAENPAGSNKNTSKTLERSENLAKSTNVEAPDSILDAKTGRTTTSRKTSSEGLENALEANLDQKEQIFTQNQRNFGADVPASREEFLEILHNIPLSVFSKTQMKQFEAITDLDFTTAEELMLPKNRITYVDQNEILGPLTLDRLFRSGMEHFPVTDAKNQIIGCIHTARLNNLDIKQSSKARDILDPNVYYVRMDYTLSQVLEVFLKTESYFVLVIDKYGKIVGILNFTDLIKHLFGEMASDGFLHDDDRLAVAKRKFTNNVRSNRYD